MERSGQRRKVLAVLAVIRAVVGILAIPLAPFLYKEHFLVLVLMRPTKEVLLAAGFLIRLGKVWWVPVIAAAVPLAILGVWQFYYLGRQYAPQIRSGKLPWWLKRVLPPKRVKAMHNLLQKKGMKLVFLGRLAVFPSSLVGAAAGSGDIKSRDFLPADAAGGLLSIAEVVGAGYALGYTYKKAGPWISVAGVAALALIGFVSARFLRTEKKAARGRRAARATSRS
jgi:membrane-associated protein